MESIQFFDEFVLSCSSQEVFFSEQQHFILSQYINKLLNINNIFMKLPKILTQIAPAFEPTISYQLVQFNSKNYCKKAYIFMLLMLGILKKFPNCFTSKEFLDIVQVQYRQELQKFYEIIEPETKALSITTNHFIVTTIIQVLSAIKAYGESTANITGDLITNISLYGNEHLSNITSSTQEQQLTSILQQCPFSTNSVMQNHFSQVFNITIDLISQLRDQIIIAKIQKFLFNNLKELQVLMDQEIKYLPERNQLQQLPFVDLRLKYQYQVIICAGIIQGLSSCYSFSYAYLVSQKQNCTKLQLDMIKQIADLIINVVFHFQNGLDADDDTSEQIAEIYQLDDFSSTPISLENQQEILKAEALHYFVVCSCLPLVQICKLLEDNNEYEQIYQGCGHFSKALQYAYQQGNVCILENLTNLNRGGKLYYHNLFKFCTCQTSQDKIQVASQPEFILLYFSDKIYIPVEELALYINNDDAVFDISEALLNLIQNKNIQLNDLFNIVTTVNSKQSNIPNQLTCFIYIALFKFFHIALTQQYTERSVFFNLVGQTNLQNYLHQQFFVQRNTYFSNILFHKKIDDTLDLVFEPCSMKFLDEIIGIQRTTEQLSIKLQKDKLSKENTVNLFYQFIDDDNLFFTKLDQICSLALQSSDNALNIVEGLLLCMINTNLFTQKKISHISLCCLINTIIRIQGANGSLLRILVQNSVQAQLVLFDIIGSWALGSPCGQSLVMAEVFQIEQDDEKMQPDDFLQEPFTVSQFQRLFSGDYSLNQSNPLQEILYHNKNIIQPFFANQNTEMNQKRPFYFLIVQDLQQTDIITYLCEIVSTLQITIENLTKTISSETDQHDFIKTLFNATYITMYLLDIKQILPQQSILLKHLNYTIQDLKQQNYNHLQPNLKIIENFTTVKLAIFKLLKYFEMDAITSEINLLIKYNKGSLKQIFENVFPTDFLFQQKQVFYTANKTILLTSFFTSLISDFNSQKYDLPASIITSSTVQHIPEFYKQIQSSDLYLQISTYSIDVLLSLHTLVASNQFDTIEEPNDDVLMYLDNYNKLSEYDVEVKRYPIDYSSFENQILQHSVTFYCQTKIERLSKSFQAKSSLTDYAILIIKTFVRIFQDVCKYQTSFTLVKEQNQHQLAFVQFYCVLLSAFCDFLQDTKQTLRNQQVWQCNFQLCAVKEYYTLILQSVFKIHTKIQDEKVQHVSILTLKQLFQLLNPNSIYDQNFLNPILRINDQSPYSESELDSILRNSAIGTCQSSELVQFLRNQQTGLALSKSLLKACLYNNENYVQASSYCAYQQPQSMHFQSRNQANMIVPVSLLLVFRFHPLLSASATILLNPILNTQQSFIPTPLINEILQDLIETHQSLIQFKDPFGFQQQNQFAAELLFCLKHALSWLLKNVQLQNDSDSQEFVNIICGYIQVQDLMNFALEFKVENAQKDEKITPEIQLLNKDFVTTQSFNRQLKDQQNGHDDSNFEIKRVLTAYFIALCTNKSNFDLLFSNSICNLAVQSNQNNADLQIVKKLNVIVLSLFLVNPVQVLINLNALSCTNSVEAFIILHVISRKNESHVPVFLQFLIKNCLDFEHVFRDFIGKNNEFDPDDVSSDTSSDDYYGFQSENLNSYSKLLIQQIFKYRLSVENFLILAINMLIIQNIITNNSVQFFVQNQLNLEQPDILQQIKPLSAAMDSVVTNILNVTLITIFRSIFDFAGIIFSSSQILQIVVSRHQKLFSIQQNQSGFSNSVLFCFEMTKRIIMQLNQFQTFDTRAFATKPYNQLDGQFFKTVVPQSPEIAIFEQKYLKILSQFSPKLWSDYVLQQLLALVSFLSSIISPTQKIYYEKLNLTANNIFEPVIQQTPNYPNLTANSEFKFAARGAPNTKISPYTTAFFLEILAQIITQLNQPEELSTTPDDQVFDLNSLNNFAFSAEFFVILHEISLFLATGARSGNAGMQQFQALKFLDVVQAVLGCSVSGANLTNFVVPGLVAVSLGVPTAEIGFRTGFLCDSILKEGVEMCPQGIALSCIFKEGIGRVQESRDILLLNSSFYIVQSDGVDNLDNAIESIYDHFGLGELRHNMRQQRQKFEEILVQNNYK
ncbi:hypothetical protein SS50377_23667 [Spironucleus salmonicida]|uniref:Uncharacterized protein n=1 Tax=Spironucleus salmonicida TaxID=348837 RepID=V6LVM6_9EUKA|nr:hypothetical protein SS50377_23667 [Spironucleus salmonicida]|eukprot:EST48650.1 Hypothetical protein SS50377_11263 [Spironucleus salmonicida]